MGYYKIVSDEKQETVNKNSIRGLFARRNFKGVADALERKKTVDDLFLINKALTSHLLGNYDVANEYYEKIKNDDMGFVNYLASCHRYFDYKKIGKIEPSGNRYQLAIQNNYFNYFASTNGIEDIDKKNIQLTIYTERILNDLYTKIGRPLQHAQNDILKSQYLQTVEIQKKKEVSNEKKKIGIFVTDIQRHKDSAMIFELVDCLKNYFEIVIYFNNIFANKLAKHFEDICTVRYVISLYYEEINNLIYNDNIDVLIDMGELGLRNNNIALCLIKNSIPLHKLLSLYPILLETDSYYPPESAVEKENFTCVIGDFRCLTDKELTHINSQIEGTIEFESHSLDEPVFMKNFERRLVYLGYDMNRIKLQPGILPFSKYMDHIRRCKSVVITSGTSYAELSEVLKSHVRIESISENSLIKKAYDVYHRDKDSNESNLKQGLIQYLDKCGVSELYKIKNKKSRIAYFEGGKELIISNTCNGDIVLLGG